MAELAGWVRSTSFLPPSVLGDQGTVFDNDLAAVMGRFAAADGTIPQDVGFAYDLARKADGFSVGPRPAGLRVRNDRYRHGGAS